MSRGKGARKPCDVQQARQRLVRARQFLEAAEPSDRARIAPEDAESTQLLRARYCQVDTQRR